MTQTTLAARQAIFVVPSATESALPARARRITVAVNRRALVRVAFIAVTPL